MKTLKEYYDNFYLCPKLSGCILFAQSEARAKYLNNYFICHGTCSLTGGGVAKHTESTQGKDPNIENSDVLPVLNEAFTIFFPNLSKNNVQKPAEDIED